MKENEFMIESTINTPNAMSIQGINTSQSHEEQSIILVTALCLREEITG